MTEHKLWENGCQFNNGTVKPISDNRIEYCDNSGNKFYYARNALLNIGECLFAIVPNNGTQIELGYSTGPGGYANAWNFIHYLNGRDVVVTK